MFLINETFAQTARRRNDTNWWRFNSSAVNGLSNSCEKFLLSSFKSKVFFDQCRRYCFRRLFLFMISQQPENFEHFLGQAKSADIIPVVLNLPADLLTPLAVYLKISEQAENSFLLESVEGGESLARYSFIGANPEMIVSGNDSEISIRKNGFD